jgi:uncharacterized membrane protein
MEHLQKICKQITQFKILKTLKICINVLSLLCQSSAYSRILAVRYTRQESRKIAYWTRYIWRYYLCEYCSYWGCYFLSNSDSSKILNIRQILSNIVDIKQDVCNILNLKRNLCRIFNTVHMKQQSYCHCKCSMMHNY